MLPNLELKKLTKQLDKDTRTSLVRKEEKQKENPKENTEKVVKKNKKTNE